VINQTIALPSQVTASFPTGQGVVHLHNPGAQNVAITVTSPEPPTYTVRSDEEAPTVDEHLGAIAFEAFSGRPITNDDQRRANHRVWERVATAVREEFEARFQNPTPDAYAAATKALDVHRTRAEAFRKLITDMLTDYNNGNFDGAEYAQRRGKIDRESVAG
jgi:hypothetical protein